MGTTNINQILDIIHVNIISQHLKMFKMFVGVHY